MKKLFTLAALALFALGANAQQTTKDSIVVDTTYTYDFQQAGKPAISLNNANYTSYFFAWEKEGKGDSRRQDYKGYAVDSLSKAAGLPEVCHIWVRQPRLVQSIYDNGFNFTGDKEFVVDGLKAGDKVVFKYTSEATDSSKMKIVYATGESGRGGASIKGITLKAGESLINSGDTITIDSANFTNKFTEGAGYLAIHAYKNTILANVSIIDGDSVTLYDLAKAGAPISINNDNGKTPWYVYEKADKADSRRQDFRGYKADDKSAQAGLPGTCYVWQRQDRIAQNITHKGVKATRDIQWAVNGLDSTDQVQIYYSANGLDSAKTRIKYATGATAKTVAFLGDSADTLLNATPLASGEIINIASAVEPDGAKNPGGYIGFQVYKGMYIQKIVITKRHIEKVPVVNGITTINAVKHADDPNAPIYNLAGQRVDKSFRGVVIQNGKKFFQNVK